MDTFTIVLIVLGAALVVGIVVSQVRGRRSRHHIAQNAPMDSNDNNSAHYMSRTNIHNGNDFGGTAGGL
ncbi:hypothetical protein [Nocardioides conyzicola]|uniref:Uncharacterized protein n=1 Tax=Nocardioides conyzicola TaxID=1651781 RepID=A0ABP8XGQ3_9ACTN